MGANSASAKAAVAAAEQRDAFISRNTGGMSFAFSEKDCRMYLAGGLMVLDMLLQYCEYK